MGTVVCLLTLFSALLYTLSFPPVSFFPLAWVALVPFFLAASMVRPRTAAACGILWGVGMACGVAWCLPTMLSHYFRLSALGSWLSFFAIGFGLAGVYFGTFAAWLSWLAHRQVASPLLVAAGWGACEFARANLFVGNPWALSGYSQVACTRLMQIADATGPYGVGMLIAAVNACLAGLFAPTLRGKRLAASCMGVGAICGSALLYGGWRLSQPFAVGEPVEVAVIQGAIERHVRWSPEHRQANLGRYLTLTKEAALLHSHLIFWPEYAVDFYLQEKGPEQEALFDAVRNLSTNLILGGPHYGYGMLEPFYHNSVFLIRRGQLAGRYDKIRLVPFAEGTVFGRRFSRGRPSYEPGRRFHILRTDGLRLGAFVCFEAMSPELARGFALQGADVLANPSNDDWFGHAAPARHQLDIATVRAIENRRYLVRPTVTGFSAIIDPYGRAVALSDFGTPQVLTGSVRRSRAQTPYQRWGDTAAWIAVGCAIVVSLHTSGRVQANATKEEHRELPVSIS